MFHKLKASVIKECLLLLRDRVGLAILFIMPMVLILVMTLIQDSAFKSLNEKGIPIVFVDEDQDSLGIFIKKGLSGSEQCSISDRVHGKPATAESARKAVSQGEFMLAIVIPKGATASVRKSVSGLVTETFNADVKDTSATKAAADSINIEIIIDPVTKKSFVTSIMSNLREFISETKTRIMFQTFSEQIAEIMPENSSAPKQAFARTNLINYKETYASSFIGELVPNAVQHNVPAWTIFAMFFIVIPLAGSIMKEKSEGSIFRLHTMPSSYLLLINGKIIVYVFVCIIQFLLMLTVGLYILPMMGLPTLVLGNSIAGIAVVTIATAFAATGYGVMVGTLASTEQQGAIMGSLSILLLSAIGGVWVPTYVMPELMRNLSVFSPLNWSLDGFYKLFLRGAGVKEVLFDAFKLALFFLLTMSIASIINRIKQKI